MAPRKSLTVSPLSVLVETFLKASPAICGFGAAAAGAAAGACATALPVRATPISHTAVPPATANISRLDQSFILCLSFRKCVVGVGLNFRFAFLAVIQYTSKSLPARRYTQKLGWRRRYTGWVSRRPARDSARVALSIRLR